jgi:hypothetical protein
VAEGYLKQLPEVLFGMLLDSQRSTRPNLKFEDRGNGQEGLGIEVLTD